MLYVIPQVKLSRLTGWPGSKSWVSVLQFYGIPEQ
jgi:hypothetical protein